MLIVLAEDDTFANKLGVSCADKKAIQEGEGIWRGPFQWFHPSCSTTSILNWSRGG